jgi:hypothetical protein
MSASSSTSGFKTLLAFAALAGALEGAVALGGLLLRESVRDRFAPPATLRPALTRDMDFRKARARPGAVVFDGASPVRAAVDPQALDEAFAAEGLRFSRLALPGGTMLDFLAEADRVLALRPRGVALMTAPTMFSLPYGDRDRLRLFFHPRVLLPLARTEGPAALWRLRWGILEGGLSRLSSLYKHRSVLRNAAFGRAPAEAAPGDAGEELLPLQRLAFGRYADLLARAGVPLVLIDSPVAPPPAKPWYPRPAGYEDFLRAQASQRGLRLLTAADFPRLDAEHFRDPVHLNEAGRARFTEFLRRRIAADGWFR